MTRNDVVKRLSLLCLPHMKYDEFELSKVSSGTPILFSEVENSFVIIDGL
jgi:hypothetical protein